jgi:hypothetical protein
LLALLYFIQPHPHIYLEWCCEDRSVSKRAWADFVLATHPSNNEIAGQHVGNQLIVRFVEIVLRSIERAGRNEAKARVNVPIDFRISSKLG